MPLTRRLHDGIARLRDVPGFALTGRVQGLSALSVEIAGLAGHLSVGDRVALRDRYRQNVEAEIVGFRQGLAQAVAFGDLAGIGPGCPVFASASGLLPRRSATPG